jgi:hypothetical protein
MRGETCLELRQRILPAATDRGLRFLRRALLANSRLLLRGTFSRGGRGCLVHHLGRFHPACAGAESPGLRFLELCGLGGTTIDHAEGKTVGSRLIYDWDSHAVAGTELVRVPANELRARRAAERRRKPRGVLS